MATSHDLISLCDVIRTIDPELPMQHLELLLLAYTRPGVTHKQVSDRLETSASSVIRIYGRLAKHGWVESTVHPEDGRARQLWITPNGQQFIARLLSKVS
jgi:hypothetical protein